MHHCLQAAPDLSYKTVQQSDAQHAKFVTISRRNVWREAAGKPLNRQFCAAGGSADAAEMTPLQRIAPVMPPLRNCRNFIADVREKVAENAKAKT
jgi:hypothetical protein